MASEIKLVAQPRDGGGSTKTFDYKPGGKHQADAKTIYKIVVDGQEQLPPGTKIVRKGNSVVYEFADGQTFELTDWCGVSDSRLVDLNNSQAYSVEQGAYVNAKEIESGACLIVGDAGQAATALGDGTASGAGPVAAAGDNHNVGGVLTGIIGLAALAALASGGDGGGGGGGSGSAPDHAKPTAGVPTALTEDFAPVQINAASLNATDKNDAGGNAAAPTVQSAKIISTTGLLQYSDDGDNTNDDVQIVRNTDGTYTLKLNDNGSGANKFGTVTAEVDLVDAAGNHQVSNVVFVVNAANDVPVNSTAAPAVGIPSEQPIDRSAGFVLSVADADEATGPDNHKIDSVVLEVVNDANGKLNIASNPHAATIQNNDSGTVTITGTQEQINSALESLQFRTFGLTADKNVDVKMTSTDKSGATDVDVVVLKVAFGGALVGNSAQGGGGVKLGLSDLLVADSSTSVDSAHTTSIPLSNTSLTHLIGEVHQTA